MHDPNRKHLVTDQGVPSALPIRSRVRGLDNQKRFDSRPLPERFCFARAARKLIWDRIFDVPKTSNDGDNRLTREQRVLRLLRLTRTDNSIYGHGGRVKSDRYKPKPVTLPKSPAVNAR
jgi:hypothetical protein